MYEMQTKHIKVDRITEAVKYGGLMKRYYEAIVSVSNTCYESAGTEYCALVKTGPNLFCHDPLIRKKLKSLTVPVKI